MKLVVYAFALTSTLLALPAQARDAADCKEAWARAARSYLKQNRTAAPDGKTPANMDDTELANQAWMEVFAGACQTEASGNKVEARLEAAAAAAAVLSKLDPAGCSSFMTSYMGSDRGKDVCDLARSGGSAELKEKIKASVPATPQKR